MIGDKKMEVVQRKDIYRCRMKVIMKNWGGGVLAKTEIDFRKKYKYVWHHLLGSEHICDVL